MYTVVLMAAITSGSSAPDWHRHGGCHGSVAWGACYGSCYGCYGAGAGGYAPAFGGTCVGTYGGYYVSGPNQCYGCWGGWSSNFTNTVYAGPGSYGYADPYANPQWGVPGYGVSFQCHGCYGCYGGWSCYGSPMTPAGTGTSQVPVAPVNPQGVPGEPPPAVPETPAPKKTAQVRSKVIIEVPEGAKLFVDDVAMKDGPTQRVFQTPPLNANETYFYDIRVEVSKNGKVVSSDSQRLVIRPGDTLTASFREPGRPEIVTAGATGIPVPR
jgi:uncharacterized protein (TIGR03000 family)